MFYKKSVLRNFTKFTGKHLCQSLFYNKIAGLTAFKKFEGILKKTPMSRKNLLLQLWPEMLSANQIAVLFDHQYLLKESRDLLDFMYGDSRRKVAF